jgi:hypothetical protein
MTLLQKKRPMFQFPRPYPSALRITKIKVENIKGQAKAKKISQGK